jgi:uncharacterized protein
MFKSLVAVIALLITVFCAAPASANTILDPANNEVTVSQNKQTVQRYMDAFNKSDHAAILSCLTDDVEWVLPGVFNLKGKDAFDKEIGNPAFVGSPVIKVARLTGEGDIVVAEGTVRTQKKDGPVLNLVFCDVFEMRDGKIKKLISYLMEVKE